MITIILGIVMLVKCLQNMEVWEIMILEYYVHNKIFGPPFGLTSIGLPPIGLPPIGLTPIGLTPIGLTPIWTDPNWTKLGVFQMGVDQLFWV